MKDRGSYDEYGYRYGDDDKNDVRAHDRPHDRGSYADHPGDHGNEMARSAVERFLESEVSEDMAYDARRRELPPHTDEMPHRDEPMMEAPPEMEHHGHVPPPPRYGADDEYMSRLADARMERQRRMDKNPEPRPAVRVNVERPRRSHPVVTEPVEVDTESAPMAEEDFDNFRRRYSEPHVMTPPPREKPAPRPAAKRRKEAEVVEGPSPLRYMVAIIAVGILGLMTFLAANNRNLRVEVDRYRAQATAADDNTEELLRANVEIAGYQQTIAELEAELADRDAQLAALGQASGDDDPDADADDTTRPEETTTEETTQAPPAVTGPRVIIAQRGDNVWRIARRYYGSDAQVYRDAIIAANELIPPNYYVFEGDEIIIPVVE